LKYSLRVSYIWHTLLATLPTVEAYFLAVVAFTIVELVIPAERRQPACDHLANLQYVLLYYVVTPFAMIVPAALATAFARRFGYGFLHLDLNRIRLGIAAVDWLLRYVVLPFVPLLVFDFFYYWHHRWQHSVASLWAIHRLHHSTESLNALAAYRIHWLEEPMRVFTITMPMMLICDITPVQGAWLAFVFGQLGTMIHANLRIPFGRLTPLLVGPQLHRLHHSVHPEHFNRNYAAIFPLWDVLFGTYLPPTRREWPATGLGREQRARDVAYETAQPFLSWGRNISRWHAGYPGKRPSPASAQTATERPPSVPLNA
jgi:sterol desaturase/sphingolipid hydroxylase (fatty acid hydroxylase superfamily)